jgi:guanylate kinase
MNWKKLKNSWPTYSRIMNKLIVFAAPSGSGKSTIVRHLLKKFDFLSFSISATTREPRIGEIHGKDYYFIQKNEFENKIKQGEFLEWEEVYSGLYYGTLHSEIKRIWNLKKTILFDIDVKGALAIKKAYPKETLTVFVKVPSIEILIQRLSERNTESPEMLQKRIEKIELENTFIDEFEVVILNNTLNIAFEEAENLVLTFLNK